MALGKHTAVIRMSKVISHQVPIITKWLTALNNGETIYPFKNLLLSPISLNFVVSVLASNRFRGIVHISSEKQLSYADFALELAKGFDFPLHLVQPVNVEDTNAKLVHNPRFTRLDMTDTTNDYGVKPQSLLSVVNDMIQEYSELNLDSRASHSHVGDTRNTK